MHRINSIDLKSQTIKYNCMDSIVSSFILWHEHSLTSQRNNRKFLSKRANWVAECNLWNQFRYVMMMTFAIKRHNINIEWKQKRPTTTCFFFFCWLVGWISKFWDYVAWFDSSSCDFVDKMGILTSKILYKTRYIVNEQ